MPAMPVGYVGAMILGGFVWFFCAYLAYMAAKQRHRRPLTWAILGIFFGPFALFAVYLMPPGHVHEGHPATVDAHDHGTGTAHHEAHGHQSPTQADLYEVPKDKHKH